MLRRPRFEWFRPLSGSGAGVVEKLGDLRGDGGHDGRVEELVDAGQEQGADDDRDEDLETRIHVVFSRRAGEHDLGADDDGFDLFDDGANTVLDLVDDGLKEAHVTSLSLIGFWSH